MKFKEESPIDYKFIFKNSVAVGCKITRISTGEEKTIRCVWPPSAVTRSAYLVFGLELPENLK